MMKSPIILDSQWVHPIASGEASCDQCSIRAGRWCIGKQPNDYTSCAYCFLYKTPWGEANADHIGELVSETERALGRAISANGKVLPEESDRILQAIVIVSGLRSGNLSKAF